MALPARCPLSANPSDRGKPSHPLCRRRGATRISCHVCRTQVRPVLLCYERRKVEAASLKQRSRSLTTKNVGHVVPEAYRERHSHHAQVFSGQRAIKVFGKNSSPCSQPKLETTRQGAARWLALGGKKIQHKSWSRGLVPRHCIQKELCIRNFTENLADALTSSISTSFHGPILRTRLLWVRV